MTNFDKIIVILRQEYKPMYENRTARKSGAVYKIVALEK